MALATPEWRQRIGNGAGASRITLFGSRMLSRFRSAVASAPNRVEQMTSRINDCCPDSRCRSINPPVTVPSRFGNVTRAFALAFDLDLALSLSDSSDRHRGELLSSSIKNNASRDFRAKLEENRRFTDLDVDLISSNFFQSEI